ncbi:uncharacterized protein LOC106879925 isoform X2 [Octopus bimaculoides]|uniref:Uncharacterized protein n=1 Tax=Octopus bimaculoides TaxID=37653 RepID=A0A0L8G154_OCTBM|nr:uncharacterized protein LOC106879925 isoform X2 [Octopus bimaculoides]|eukprot:XP_014785164.1 PREDICTED: uncharacterized protein LOC106879925 isoform X2 [Octopus bimaculoides]
MKDIFLMTLLLWLCVVPEVFCTTSKNSALKIRIRANNLLKFWRWLPIKDIYDPKKRPALKSWKICDNNEQSLGGRLASNGNLINIRSEEPLGIKTMKRTGPFRQQSTGPPTGWWLYANGFDNRGKKLEKKFLGRNESAFSSGTVAARTLLEDFNENLKLKNNGKLEVCLNR